MRTLLVTLIVGFMSFGLAVDYADARRFGGGATMGQQSRSATAGPAQQNTAPQSGQQQQGAGAAAAGAGGFMGPLMGLAAGGLLASLFFGGAFEGFRMIDFVLIALIGFGIYLFVSSRSRKAFAGQSREHGEQNNQQSNWQGFRANNAHSGSSIPAWFNTERFLEDAKGHFANLQKAWDDNNLEEIQDYVKPELYNLLREERAKEPSNNKTEIVHLFAELGGVREYGNEAEASVLFHGVLVENGERTEFSEVWHLIRNMRDQAPWHIQGIEQRNQ